MGSIPLPETVDLSHHLNTLSKSRHPSPLKDLIRYMGVEGMIGLAGGLPHPSYFPFQNLSLDTSIPSGLSKTAEQAKAPSLNLTISKLPSPDSSNNLASFLQYGTANGNTALLSWLKEFTKKVFQPARHDFEVLVNSGNTDAWGKIMRLLCEPGELILCEEFTYPTAQATWTPLGCRAVSSCLPPIVEI